MFPTIETSLLYLFPFLIFMFFICSNWVSSDSKIKKNLPPSPRGLPVIGNLHQLGSSPHSSLRALAQKHGPLMLLRLGSMPVLVASSAEAAKLILKTHDLIFCSRPRLTIPHKLLYRSKDIAFAPYGEYWRQIRSITVMHLLSNKQVQSFRQVREEEMALTIDTIGKSCGSVINLTELVVALTNSVVCRVALGRTYRDRKFKDLMVRMVTLMGTFSIGGYIPWLSWVDRLSGLESKVDKVAKELDEFFEGVVEEHINKRGGVDSGGGHDLVDILLDVQTENETGVPLTRESIKAVILDIFVAGTDTTSGNLEWAISELLRHPRVMKKLQQEVTEIAQGKHLITEEDLDKMQYLKAVLKESMRCHSPLPLLVPREAIEDVKLMGYDIAAGTKVIVNVQAICMDPSVWEEPDEFRPERFLNSSIDVKGLHFELLPFGAGRRGCPGVQFAVTIDELALANLVYRYDLALPDDGRGEGLDMREISGLTVNRKSPLLVVATPRF